jgi:hypothetical protein
MELTVENYIDMRVNQRMTKQQVLFEIERPNDYVYLKRFEEKYRIKKLKTQLDVIGVDVFIEDYHTITYQEMADKYNIPKATVIDYGNNLRKQGMIGLKPRIVINQYRKRELAWQK